MVIGPFENKTIAENVIKYMQTKFFRFLVGSRKNKNMTQETYSFAPMLDFSKEWTDEALYDYFSLDNDDIQYIEKMIDSNNLVESMED